MSKTLAFIFSSFSFLCASDQLVMVLSDDMNATSAMMQRYEKRGIWIKTGLPVSVTLGRSGLGYAAGKEPLKMEGDGRTPAGLFALSSTFGYDEMTNSRMTYLHADEHLICIDDQDDPRYNRIVTHTEGELPKSFEWMRREDDVYRNGAVIDYNSAGEKGRGSCIFIHLNHADKHPTSGCTAMDEAPLKELLGWLDSEKKPMILQIPKSDCGQFQKELVGIDCE